MTKAEIQAKITVLQTQLGILNNSPSDTYPIGTMVVFSAAAGQRWYRLKIAEELWRNMTNVNEERSLAEWILAASESNIGYFEVYVLTVAATPIFASS
jgi:hypothetical protein